MFTVSDSPLDSAALRAKVLDPSCGAVASFEGFVRNHHHERAVDHLEYEAHPLLAEKEGRSVVAEALERFEISHAIVVHRVGSLAIGDVAIVIHVSSAHRAAAFDACRFLIDEIKHRVPIWKREHYTDGSVIWVEQCEGCSASKSEA